MDSFDPYVNARAGLEFSVVEKTIADLIYQNGLTEDKINAYLNCDFTSDFGGSAWPEKGQLNFPGPFYTGITDTCGTGIIESPSNVVFDEWCMEYVMIQPRNKPELLQLWSSGAVEVFGGYYCDGNRHWTVQLVKEWWRRKSQMVEHLKKAELVKMNRDQEKRYIQYLMNDAEIDLRRYCFFLENGYYPENESLPELN